jgi:hypothetical protein
MKELFCVKCGTFTPHTGAVDQNGEFIFHCQNTVKDAEGDIVVDAQGNPVRCDMFVKFPRVANKAELLAKMEAHAEVNKAVVEAVQGHKEQQNILADVLADGTEVTISENEE